MKTKQTKTQVKEAKLNKVPESPRRSRHQSEYCLRFSPTAWAKLLYFRDKSHNEVGGFGVSDAEDLLYVKDFVTVKQEVTGVSVKFDDQAVADYFDDQVDQGRKPEQIARVWCHTHPGFSPEPSWIDEETFGRVFGGCQWALMFILSADGQTYARLSFNVGPRGCILVPVKVDYSQEFDGSDWKAWDAEYETNVRAAARMERLTIGKHSDPEKHPEWCGLSYDFLDELEQMDVQERQLVLNELADRQDLWDEESEVMFL